MTIPEDPAGLVRQVVPRITAAAHLEGIAQGAPLVAGLGASVADLGRRPGAGPTPCSTCGNDATTQWARHATAAEAEDAWSALEQNIRASNSGRPDVDYVADRTQPVVKAVFGCDEHVVPNPHLVHDADCGGHGNCQCPDEDAEG